MEQPLLFLLKTIPEYASLLEGLKERQSAAVTGVGQINRSHMIAGLSHDLGKPIVVLCQDDMAARRTQEELKCFLGFPPPILPGKPGRAVNHDHQRCDRRPGRPGGDLVLLGDAAPAARTAECDVRDLRLRPRS